MDTQDKKDETKQGTAEKQEEIKKVDAPDKETSYQAEPQDAE